MKRMVIVAGVVVVVADGAVASVLLLRRGEPPLPPGNSTARAPDATSPDAPAEDPAAPATSVGGGLALDPGATQAERVLTRHGRGPGSSYTPLAHSADLAAIPAPRW